ncbi:MAG: hypothetical protein QW086_08805 [Pyrobaculum sp.]
MPKQRDAQLKICRRTKARGTATPLNLVLRQILQAIPHLTPGTTPQKFREDFNNAVLNKIPATRDSAGGNSATALIISADPLSGRSASAAWTPTSS